MPVIADPPTSAGAPRPAPKRLEMGRSRSVHAVRYVCQAGPADKPYAEVHAGHSISYVSHGSFAYTARGQRHDLVAGALLVGAPGCEFVCSHEHHGHGDECLAFHFDAEAVDDVGVPDTLWRLGALPPSPGTVALGELARALAHGDSDIGAQEIAFMLAAQATLIFGRRKSATIRPGPRDRRRATMAAQWLESHAAEPVELDDVAREFGLSPFHFLRSFCACVGATPHQYLISLRIRNAAFRLATDDASITDIAYASGFGDLSHFIRSFRRATGKSPSAFRRAYRSERSMRNRNFRQA